MAEQNIAALPDIEVRAHSSRRLDNVEYAEVPYNLNYFIILIKIHASYIQHSIKKKEHFLIHTDFHLNCTLKL